MELKTNPQTDKIGIQPGLHPSICRQSNFYIFRDLLIILGQDDVVLLSLSSCLSSFLLMNFKGDTLCAT